MDEEQNIIEKLDEAINLDELEKVSFSDVKRPLVFGEKDVFEFELLELGAFVIKDQKTKVGTQDMYILITNPKIYCFRNALKQLEKFAEKLKLPAKIKYLGREGSQFDTVYNFEVVKK